MWTKDLLPLNLFRDSIQKSWVMIKNLATLRNWMKLEMDNILMILGCRKPINVTQDTSHRNMHQIIKAFHHLSNLRKASTQSKVKTPVITTLNIIKRMTVIFKQFQSSLIHHFMLTMNLFHHIKSLFKIIKRSLLRQKRRKFSNTGMKLTKEAVKHSIKEI